MIGYLLAALLVAFVAAPAWGSGLPCPGVDTPVQALDSEVVTVGGTAIGLTAAKYAGKTFALVQPLNDGVYYLATGVAATTANAQLLPAAQAAYVCGAAMGHLSMIQQATGASVRVQYYGQ